MVTSDKSLLNVYSLLIVSIPLIQFGHEMRHANPTLEEQASVGGRRWHRALVRSYRLSIVTMLLTEAVWPKFAMHVYGGAVSTHIGS